MVAYLGGSTKRARRLRRDATPAEARLWFRLRRNQLHGAKFRRQMPVGPYVVDFCCLEARLVVELDGGQHADNPNDKVRTRFLEARGFKVLRFWNPEVTENIEGVLETILSELTRSRGPSPDLHR
jgi:very-short-patch-repair endonuclease